MLSASPDIELRVTGKFVWLPWHSIEALTQEIKRQWHADMWIPQRVLALGKGAMIPARLLANDNVPVYYTGVRSYKGEEQAELECYQQIADGEYITADDFLNDLGTLIVDDLWDTGATFEWAAKKWPLAKKAALMSKKTSSQLDYCGLVFPTEAWVVFPWESGR